MVPRELQYVGQVKGSVKSLLVVNKYVETKLNLRLRRRTITKRETICISDQTVNGFNTFNIVMYIERRAFVNLSYLFNVVRLH